MSKKCTFMGNTDATPSTEILNKAQTIVVDLINTTLQHFTATDTVHLTL